MAHYPSLQDGAFLEALFRRFPRGISNLMGLHDDIMRAPSEIDVATRELIAAYVSGLNACAFCYGAHKTMAQAFGVDPQLIESLVQEGIEAAPLEDKLKPLLAYIRVITLEPAKASPSLANNVYAAGWSEDALYDAVMVAALYAFMNRILDGAGLTPKPLFDAPSEDDLKKRREGSYTEWARDTGLMED